MKVFVTTGTTAFEELSSLVVEISEQFEIILQTPECVLDAKNARVFSFVEDIESYYDWADVVVTHAGAGSVYRLLELGKRIVVVPNLTRKDPHQLQLAKYVDDSAYGEVCYNMSELKTSIISCAESTFSRYERLLFDDVTGILNLFGIKN